VLLGRVCLGDHLIYLLSL
jgi:hypothetical protein